jgi:methionyl aminopeptidase
MLNAGTARIKMRPDGWTALTADGSLSAQFEHQLAVRTDRIEVLTAVE